MDAICHKTGRKTKSRCIRLTKDFEGGNFTPFTSLFTVAMRRSTCAPQSTDMRANIYGGLLTENVFTFDSLRAHTDMY